MLYEDINSIANRFENTIRDNLDCKKLLQMINEDKIEAEKYINEVLDKTYNAFIDTLSDNKQREIESLILFYVNEKLPKLKSACRTIYNDNVKLDYYINNTACKYLSKNINKITEICEKPNSKYDLIESKKRDKLLKKQLKLQKKNQQKAKKISDKLTKETEETL